MPLLGVVLDVPLIGVVLDVQLLGVRVKGLGEGRGIGTPIRHWHGRRGPPYLFYQNLGL